MRGGGSSERGGSIDAALLSRLDCFSLSGSLAVALRRPPPIQPQQQVDKQASAGTSKHTAAEGRRRGSGGGERERTKEATKNKRTRAAEAQHRAAAALELHRAPSESSTRAILARVALFHRHNSEERLGEQGGKREADKGKRGD